MTKVRYDRNDGNEGDTLQSSSSCEEGEIQEICLKYKTPSNVRGSSNMSRRVQKWKNLARDRPSKLEALLQFCPVREKRPISGHNYDEHMVEAEDRGKLKKQNAPMEVDESSSYCAEQVAGPTPWALGSQ